MAYDCPFQATIKDHIPLEYYRFIGAERKPKVNIPARRAMFVKKCMAAALTKQIPPTPRSIMTEGVKRNGLRHSIFNSRMDVYTGEWQNDYKQGHGCYKSSSERTMYEGEWKQGKADGFGILYHRGDQKRYNISFEGFFKGGKPQGHGYKFYKDGSYYEGNWQNGVRTGYGKMWYADETYYEGAFYDNQRQGQGLFVYKNGNRYVGKWNDNMKHGLGALYFMDKGQIQMGHWNRDRCVNSWFVDIKYRQTALQPTEFSIPTKDPDVKQLKRYVKENIEKHNTRDTATQTD